MAFLQLCYLFRAFNKKQSKKNFVQTLNVVFSVITFFGEKMNRSPEVNSRCL